MLNKKEISDIKSKLSDGDIAFSLAFQALGDARRLNIFKLLMQYHEICVTDVSNIFGITVSAASQQLRNQQ